MKKGVKNFCNGDASTSTLNQHNPPHSSPSLALGSPCILANNNNTNNNKAADSAAAPTLEQMILQLELEEENARKAKQHNDIYGGGMMRPGRMSCVNNSDILRSARNALNQYPRFSLDGKDAMYRSSFLNMDSFGKAHGTPARRRSVCCERGVLLREGRNINSKSGRNSTVIAGESVVWCKPGVVAKLMGLEAMPVPIKNREKEETFGSVIKRQNLRRRAERHEMERRLAIDMRDGGSIASCSKTGYCVMKPVVAVEPAHTDGSGGWPTRRFH